MSATYAYDGGAQDVMSLKPLSGGNAATVPAGAYVPATTGYAYQNPGATAQGLDKVIDGVAPQQVEVQMNGQMNGANMSIQNQQLSGVSSAAVNGTYNAQAAPQAAAPVAGGAKVGVGLVLRQSDTGYIDIVGFRPGSSAEKCGQIAPLGEILVEVDGRSVYRLAPVEVTRLILGPEGSAVRLGMRHSSDPNASTRYIDLERAKPSTDVAPTPAPEQPPATTLNQQQQDVLPSQAVDVPEPDDTSADALVQQRHGVPSTEVPAVAAASSSPEQQPVAPSNSLQVENQQQTQNEAPASDMVTRIAQDTGIDASELNQLPPEIHNQAFDYLVRLDAYPQDVRAPYVQQLVEQLNGVIAQSKAAQEQAQGPQTQQSVSSTGPATQNSAAVAASNSPQVAPQSSPALQPAAASSESTEAAKPSGAEAADASAIAARVQQIDAEMANMQQQAMQSDQNQMNDLQQRAALLQNERQQLVAQYTQLAQQQQQQQPAASASASAASASADPSTTSTAQTVEQQQQALQAQQQQLQAQQAQQQQQIQQQLGAQGSFNAAPATAPVPGAASQQGSVQALPQATVAPAPTKKKSGGCSCTMM